MYGVKTPIFQTTQIRACERLAVERFGISAQQLMQRAGKAAFDYLQRRWPQAQKIAVFCGAGNNGGDGYVLAQLAHERGLKVTVWQVGQSQPVSLEAKNAHASCVDAGVKVQPCQADTDFQHPDMVVDAICGIGIKDKLREDVASLINKIAELEIPILALDVPTGIDADTGNILGSALHATATMTFIGLKLGLMTGPATAYVGELVLNDLQLTNELFALIEPAAKKIHLSAYQSHLQPRPRDWHKGLSGHVLVVGGDLGYSGAVRMAAEAALRVGAGLVSVATLVDHAADINCHYPEIMAHGVTTVAQLEQLLVKADVVVLGPGLGQSEWAKKWWEQVNVHDMPKVIDADGLNLLAQTTLYHDGWVLTPHPGEAARLLNQTTADIQQDRLEAAQAISKRYGGICVLKGAGSLVVTPNVLPAVCDRGNPGMATAGMGDVLSGVIGGLIAQGIPLGVAAKLGVCVHAMAGDLAAKDGERGMVATDLLPYIHRLVNS